MAYIMQHPLWVNNRCIKNACQCIFQNIGTSVNMQAWQCIRRIMYAEGWDVTHIGANSSFATASIQVYFCNRRRSLPYVMCRPIALNGLRIGEAKNPGPKRPRLETTTIAIVNPTAIFQKETKFQEMIDNFGVHIFLCSETTATALAQNKSQNSWVNLACNRCGQRQSKNRENETMRRNHCVVR